MRSDNQLHAGARPAETGESAHVGSEHRVPCLGIIFPRDIQQCFKLGIAPRTIGSSRSADIVLNGDDVAPVHCRISMTDGQAQIEDMGSSTGTWVDDVRISSASLSTGQVLRVGHYRFMLSDRPDSNHHSQKHGTQIPGTDSVTGVPNRAWVLRRAEQVLEARADSPRPITVAVLMLDQLDDVMRHQGYQAGDSLLRGVAKLLESRLREKESIGLFGPEKLLLILPEIEQEEAQIRLVQMCRLVREQSFAIGPDTLSATLSVGYSTSEGRTVKSLDKFLTQAERALYRARRWGGNQAITLPQ